MASLFRWTISVNKLLGYFLKVKNQVAFAGKWAWPGAPTIYPHHLQTLALLRTRCGCLSIPVKACVLKHGEEKCLEAFLVQ